MQTKAGSIVVGVDGSESSDRALAWAIDRAAVERGAVTLAHAIHWVTPAYTDVAIDYPAEARSSMLAGGRKLLEQARKQVLAKSPDLEVHEVLEFLDPRELLQQLSRDAEMLVLGSRGRGHIRSLLLGSVGVALVRHAHCPVVIHRPGAEGTELNGIVVGVEASEESRTLLEFAYREASLRDLPLTVLHCFWDVQAGIAPSGVIYESISDLDEERAALAESMAGMSEKYPNLKVTSRMARGLPYEVLAHLGRQMNLIVVGAQQASRVSQMYFGSVSVALVERATCPVAVVPVSASR